MKLAVGKFIGSTPGTKQLANLYFATNLDDAARLPVELAATPESQKISAGHPGEKTSTAQ